MIRHIVTWKLAATEPEQRAADAAGMKAGLEALVGIVDGLSHLEVGSDIGEIDSNWDVVLIAEFDDNAALEGYQIHPDHIAIGRWVQSVVTEKATVDYDW